MSKYLVDGTDMESVADAIRSAGGTSEQLEFPSDFVSAIGNISGGGGVSNLVTGTFTGTTAGSALTVNIPYNGEGYPIYCMISPTEGAWKNGGNIIDVVQKSAVASWCMIKSDFSTSPTFATQNNSENRASIFAIYKNSDSDASATSIAGGPSAGTFTVSSAGGSSIGNIVRFNSDTTMSVYIAGTAYGFKSGVEYTYIVIYSE